MDGRPLSWRHFFSPHMQAPRRSEFLGLDITQALSHLALVRSILLPPIRVNPQSCSKQDLILLPAPCSGLKFIRWQLTGGKRSLSVTSLLLFPQALLLIFLAGSRGQGFCPSIGILTPYPSSTRLLHLLVSNPFLQGGQGGLFSPT